jgi:hypothetical protein
MADRAQALDACGQHASAPNPAHTREVATPPGDPQHALIRTPPPLASLCAASCAAARLATSRARATARLARELAQDLRLASLFPLLPLSQPAERQVRLGSSFCPRRSARSATELVLHRGPANAKLLHANMCLFAATGVA